MPEPTPRELHQVLVDEEGVDPDTFDRFRNMLTHWIRQGLIDPTTLGEGRGGCHRPGTVDWHEHLPRLNELIAAAERTPTTSELFTALVAEGRVDPTHRNRFRLAAVRLRRRGLLPAETVGKTGPRKGTPWPAARREAEEWAHDARRALGKSGEVLERRRLACRSYLLERVRKVGRIVFIPPEMARLAQMGWGTDVIAVALRDLVYEENVTVGKAGNHAVLVAS